MGARCIAEYGYLLDIHQPRDNFSRKEVEELYTLKHILKNNIRLNASYKKAILKMKNRGQVNIQEDRLKEMYDRGDLGLLLNAKSVGISPQEAVNNLSQSNIRPTTEEDNKENAEKVKDELKGISRKLNIQPKQKGKKRNLIDIDYQRKANFIKPKEINFRGRIDQEAVLNQNTESESMTDIGKGLDFNSNKNDGNKINRINIKW